MIPNPHFERKKEITYPERDELMYFNTNRFWHCYYNKETGVLYNEYCIRVMDDATDYLISIGLLSENKEQLKYFEE
jgi:hypothetical protein